MNEIDKRSFGSLKILSNKRSTKEWNGAMSVNGGIGIGKNLIVKDEILAREVITTNNARIGGNMYVMGTIESDSMFHVNEDSMEFIKSICPKNKKNVTIGTPNNRWPIIYSLKLDSSKIECVNLDISKEFSVGNNSINNKPLCSIGEEFENTTILNSDFIVTGEDSQVIMYLPQDSGEMLINKIKTGQLVHTEFQKVIVDDVDMYITPISNVVLLDPQIDKPATINIKSGGDSRIVKIVMKSDASNNISIDIGPETKYLKHKGHYLEILESDGEYMFIKRA